MCYFYLTPSMDTPNYMIRDVSRSDVLLSFGILLKNIRSTCVTMILTPNEKKRSVIYHFSSLLSHTLSVLVICFHVWTASWTTITLSWFHGPRSKRFFLSALADVDVCQLDHWCCGLTNYPYLWWIYPITELKLEWVLNLFPHVDSPNCIAFLSVPIRFVWNMEWFLWRQRQSRGWKRHGI